MSNQTELVNGFIYPLEVGDPNGPCSHTCAHISCILKRHDAKHCQCLTCQQDILPGSEVMLGKSGNTVWHYDCFENRVREAHNMLQNMAPVKANEVLLVALTEDEKLTAIRHVDSQNRRMWARIQIVGRWIEKLETNERLGAALNFSRSDDTELARLSVDIARTGCPLIGISPELRIDGQRVEDGVRRPRTGIKGVNKPKTEQAKDRTSRPPGEVVK